MKSTRPLAKTGSDVERLLLAAGAGERPDEESVRRAASALGIVPRAALVAATLAAAVRVARWSATATWTTAGVISLAGVAGVALVEHASQTPRAAVVAVARAAGPPLTTHMEPATAAPVDPVVVRAPAPAPAPREPAAREGARRTTALAPSRPREPASADGLRAQADVLDGARSLLSAGDARGALARLGDYDRRFARGSLREEALLLRIEALSQLGDRGAATSAARRFLDAYPSSVHASRVAALAQQLAAAP